MRLSEAIRLGAMNKPQGLGHDSMRVDAPDACALSAAGWAAGVRTVADWDGPYYPYAALYERFPILYRTDVENWPPVPGVYVGLHLLKAIITLNDIAHWSREQIADWVEQIERQQDQPVAETVPAAVETARCETGGRR